MAQDQIVVQRPTWTNEYLALVCGIANAGGGVLTLTEPDKNPGRGIARIRKSFESIPQLTRSHLGISCTTEPVMIGGELCLEIIIPPAEEPVSYEGKFYVYEDGANVERSRDQVMDLIDANADIPWELQVQRGVSIDDAEPYMVARFAEAIHGAQGDESGHDGLSNTNDDAVLASARLKDARSQSLTNAGVVLLSRTPDAEIPGAFVRLGLFDDNDYNIVLQEDVRGTLLHQLENAVDIIFDRFLPQIAQGNERAGLLPLTAISEALRNALVHKNYLSPEPVRVSVHPNRVIVENAGRPPASWNADDLLGRHVSRPSNPVIAAALQDVGEFNGWGYGISSMAQACTSAGLPQPEISIGNQETTVTFALSDNVGSAEEANGSKAKASGKTSAGEGRSRLVLPTDAKNAAFKERSIAALNDLDLTSSDEYVLKVLIANGRATATAIADFIGVSESTVRRSFRKLREYGVIERIGSDKAGYWKVLL